MTFEYLIAYRHNPDTDILIVLRDLLAEVLADNDNDIDDESVENMIIPYYKRVGRESTDEDANTSCHMLLDFSLELQEEIVQLQAVVNEFTSALPETPPILYVVKFEDPLLQQELARRSEEIFSLEMKLRRVLSMIYLNAYQDGNPYDLLCDETTQPMAKEKPDAAQMEAAAENQFFHLTFNNYINLNKRPEIKMSVLLEIARKADHFDAFRDEILRSPIEQEDDAVLLAGLKDRMNAIEAMRNCVAHNRRPSRRVSENFDNARPLLEQLLNDYLSNWTWDNGA
jgi:hypothetical protein